MRIIFTLFILFSVTISAQIYERYPMGQNFYKGGHKAFYQELHKVFVENKMTPCENEKEFFEMDFVIYPDKTVRYAKPDDSIALAKNKCAFDLAKTSAKYLDNWQPAEVDGKKVAAMQRLVIIPNDLFSRYYNGYTAEDNMKPAEFEGGVNGFREEVMKYLMPNGFNFSGRLSLVVSFVVDRHGTITDIFATRTDNPEFNRMVISGFKSVRQKWKPATINGVPVPYKFKMPLSYSST